jgi:hypothetical protein
MGQVFCYVSPGRFATSSFTSAEHPPHALKLEEVFLPAYQQRALLESGCVFCAGKGGARKAGGGHEAKRAARLQPMQRQCIDVHTGRQ